MINSLVKKGITFTVILLFIGLTLAPGITAYNNSSFVNTIYVDDDNTEGPWDGTPEHPYQFIQDAIDNASDGDTVFVYAGTYYENVVVDKSIDLTGEDRENTVIDGGGHEDVIFVTADHVNISDFAIQNSGEYYHAGTDSDAGIDIRALYVKISLNIIVNNGVGIFLFGACEAIINENIIQNAGLNGIELRDSTDNKTEGNTITGNDISYNGRHGLFTASSRYNSIYYNSFYENGEHGISVIGGSNNNITNNIIIDNYVNGIYYKSGRGSISNNTISNNDHGILAWGGSKINIINNTVSYNRGDGIYVYGGQRIIVRKNMIFNNGWYGIRFELLNTNEILDNTIQNNTGGIRFYQALWCSFFNNIISDNVECGIFLEYGSNNNDIIGNTFERNDGYAVYLDGSEGNNILSNTILQHDMTAYFEDCDNFWWRNYWNRPRILPYLIFGINMDKLSIEVDWYPRFFKN